MPDTPQRTLSDNEKIYRKYRNPQRECFHVILECTNSVDIQAVEDAFNRLSRLVPEVSYGIRNGKFIYLNSPLTIRTTQVPEFDGYNLEALNLSQELSGVSLIEIHHVESLDRDWVVFRVSHSLTDGQGMLMMLTMMFDVLKGKTIVPPNSHENDLQFISRVGHTKKHPKLFYENKLTKKSIDKRNKEYVRRVTLKRAISFPLPKIIEVLNKYYDNESLTYLIPSDLRKYDRAAINIGNLTAPLYLRCTKMDTWHQIITKIHAQLKGEEILNTSIVSYPIFTKINKSFFNALLFSSRLLQNTTRRFLTAGSITNIGSINLDNYQSSALAIKSIFFVPLFQPLLPLSISIVETRDQTELILVSNYQIIDNDTLDSIIRNVSGLA